MPTTSPTVLAHIQFKTAHDVTLKVNETLELGVYVLQRNITAGTQDPLLKGDLSLLSNGEQIIIKQSSDLPVDAIAFWGQKNN